MKKEQSQPGGTGGMSSSATGGPLLASKNSSKKEETENEKLNLKDEKKEEAMQFESILREIVKEEIQKTLREATDDRPSEPWAKFGEKVDDFINDMVEKCDELFKEGEKLLYEKDDDEKKKGGDEMYRFISSRLGFLKNARNKFAQRYEGLRREF